MSNDGGSDHFLSRWSKRKAEVRRQEQASEPEAAAPEAEEEFDIASLPSIDSLTAESDFSLFLKKGVPATLRTAALRKLWLVEPSVVNYQPLVEYNWDFTAPGYGELLPTDDIAKMAQQVFSGFSQAPRPAEAEAEAEVPVGQTAPEHQQELPAPDEQPVAEAAPVDATPQPEPEVAEAPRRRRHGGALPS